MAERPVGETTVEAPHTDLLAQEVAEGLSRAAVAGIVTGWRGPFGDGSGDKRLRRGPWYEVSTCDGRHAVYTRAEVSAFTDAVFAAERELVPAAEVERLSEALREYDRLVREDDATSELGCLERTLNEGREVLFDADAHAAAQWALGKFRLANRDLFDAALGGQSASETPEASG